MSKRKRVESVKKVLTFIPAIYSTSPSDIVVGIDLGTSKTCVAYCYEKSIQVLKNCDENPTTPSFVYFPYSNNIVVGSAAREISSKHLPQNGIYGFKRFLGQSVDNPEFQNHLENLSYFVESHSNDVLITIKKLNTVMQKTPAQICSIFLAKIKNDVEKKLGKIEKVKAVISVPAHYNAKQAETTVEAAEKAGFEVLKLIRVPTAVMYKYFYDEIPCKPNDHFLVYDLGGGTFDIAILRERLLNIETLGIGGNSFLGGQDFDNVILNNLNSTLAARYNIDFKTDKKLLRKFVDICEKTKIHLSSTEEAEINVRDVFPNADIGTIKISRSEFEHMAALLFTQTISIIEWLFETLSVSKNNIKKVILSGSSTKIPKIQTLLSDYFGPEKIHNFADPDIVVAEGAAVQAAKISNHKKQYVYICKVSEILP